MFMRWGLVVLLLMFWVGVSAQENQLDTAIELFESERYDSAFSVLEELPDDATSLRYKALIHLKRFDYRNALEHIQKGLTIADSLQLVQEKVELLEAFGTFYKEQEDIDNAMRQYTLAKTIANDAGLERNAQILNLKISAVYLSKINVELDKEKEPLLADTVLLLSDESKAYFEENVDHSLLADIYNAQAAAYLIKGDYEKADSFFGQCIYEHQFIDKPTKYGWALYNWATSNLFQEKYRLSEQQFKEVIKIGEEHDKKLRTAAKHNLTFVYYYEDNHKAALETYFDYVYEKDSLDQVAKNADLERFEADMNNQILEKERINAKADALESSLKAKKLQTWLIGISGLLLAAVFSFVFLNQRARFRRKDLEFQLRQQAQATEIRAINAMIDGREKERHSIAATLHDSVASMLASASMHLQAFKLKSSETNTSLSKTQTIIQDVTTKVRNLSHSLVSPVLLRFGLEKAIEGLCDRVNSEQLLVEHSIHLENDRFERDFEGKIFGIIEELFNNIIKHSQASQASISLSEKEGYLLLNVKDNGIGFVKEKDLGDGLGLFQISARVKSLGGETDILTTPQLGTSINIKVPVQMVPELVS
ncbi:MAG: hypothetical protein KTR13_03060 [Saprospiraceae bacterium]|nr:hypothetical protein [Saprospiraceae bacterium]